MADPLWTKDGRDSLYVDDTRGGAAHEVRKSELRPFYDVGETRTFQDNTEMVHLDDANILDNLRDWLREIPKKQNDRGKETERKAKTSEWESVKTRSRCSCGWDEARGMPKTRSTPTLPMSCLL